MSNKISEQLKDIFPEERLILDKELISSYIHKTCPSCFLKLFVPEIRYPEAIASPTGLDELSELLRWARSAKIALVPFGSGSKVSLTLMQEKEWIAVDMKKMNRIRELNKKNLTAELEAGIILERVEEELLKENLRLVNFPDLNPHSTLGGWISGSSRIKLKKRYGDFGDIVIALEGVLADGSIFHTRRTPRSATGPDIDEILIGTEGMLGIISSAVVSVHRIPSEKIYSAFSFSSLDEGFLAMREIMQKELAPTFLELYDCENIKKNKDIFGIECKERPKSSLLVLGFEEYERGILELKYKRASGICEDRGGKELERELARNWIEQRRSLFEREKNFDPDRGTVGDLIELFTSWGKLSETYETISRFFKKEGADTCAEFNYPQPEGVVISFRFELKDALDDRLKDKYFRVLSGLVEVAKKADRFLSYPRSIRFSGIDLQRQWLKKGWEIIFALKRELDPDLILNPQHFFKEKFL